MSVTFYGQTTDKHPVMLDAEDPAHMNMANGNARLFLEMLRLDAGNLGFSSGELMGETTLPLARRAVMYARATFDRRAPHFERPAEGWELAQNGGVRVITGGIDQDYLTRRLDDFERFLDAVAAKG